MPGDRPTDRPTGRARTTGRRKKAAGDDAEVPSSGMQGDADASAASAARFARARYRPPFRCTLPLALTCFSRVLALCTYSACPFWAGARLPAILLFFFLPLFVGFSAFFFRSILLFRCVFRALSSLVHGLLFAGVRVSIWLLCVSLFLFLFAYVFDSSPGLLFLFSCV